MKILGNILWVIFGGAVNCTAWFFLGVLWHITIIGIPLGKQCFKLAKLSFLPFTKEVVRTDESAIGTVANIFWAIFTGIPMAAENLLMGVLFCITIVGIPFGKQYFKLAKLSFAPFGVEVKRKLI
ncbi:MAG: YccF domain-containing protein [Clostridia bacterium]|nr:YccF domain-containing protein [Clostridia bacterium]